MMHVWEWRQPSINQTQSEKTLKTYSKQKTFSYKHRKLLNLCLKCSQRCQSDCQTVLYVVHFQIRLISVCFVVFLTFKHGSSKVFVVKGWWLSPCRQFCYHRTFRSCTWRSFKRVICKPQTVCLRLKGGSTMILHIYVPKIPWSDFKQKPFLDRKVAHLLQRQGNVPPCLSKREA